MILTEIENLLLTLPQLAAVSGRANLQYSGDSALPAVTLDFSYRLGDDVKTVESDEVLVVSLTTTATDKAIGAADIDAHLLLDNEIAALIETYYFDNSPCRARFIRESGGDVSRRTGFCQSDVRYTRNRVAYRAT